MTTTDVLTDVVLVESALSPSPSHYYSYRFGPGYKGPGSSLSEMPNHTLSEIQKVNSRKKGET